MFLRLITNGTTGAGNGEPTAETHGVPLRATAGDYTNASSTFIKGQVAGQGMPEYLDEATILVEGVGTAAAANSIAYVKLWGWFRDAVGTNKWFPLGTAATDAARGKLNNGTALGEVATGDDIIRHAERVRGLSECQRVYAEYGALTSVTRVDVTLVVSSRERG